MRVREREEKRGEGSEEEGRQEGWENLGTWGTEKEHLTESGRQ
jgi:hypothetical protein